MPLPQRPRNGLIGANLIEPPRLYKYTERPQPHLHARPDGSRVIDIPKGAGETIPVHPSGATNWQPQQ